MRVRLATWLLPLLSLTTVTGCGLAERTPEHWRTEAACERANPGTRCSFGTCDYKCDAGGAWKGWVPVAVTDR